MTGAIDVCQLIKKSVEIERGQGKSIEAIAAAWGVSASAIYKYLELAEGRGNKSKVDVTVLQRLGAYFADLGDLDSIQVLASYALGYDVFLSGWHRER